MIYFRLPKGDVVTPERLRLMVTALARFETHGHKIVPWPQELRDALAAEGIVPMPDKEPTGGGVSIPHAGTVA